MEDNNQQNLQDAKESSTAKQRKENEDKIPEVGNALTDGRISEDDLAELERKHGNGARQGNSSIPSDNEDTIGIP